MIQDKERWNKKYLEYPMPDHVTPILKKYLGYASSGHALDIACGTGRNTHFLAENGFTVDAVDISDYALSKVKNNSLINKIEVDLDNYNITPNKYDLILNTNFLNRRLVSQMKDGLKSGGMIVFETFILAHGDFKHETMNLDYLLRKNELLHTFIGMDVIYYEERVEVNLRGEKVKLASLVAKKR